MGRTVCLGLTFVRHSRRAAPLVGVFCPSRAGVFSGPLAEGLHPSLGYFALSGQVVLRGRSRGATPAPFAPRHAYFEWLNRVKNPHRLLSHQPETQSVEAGIGRETTAIGNTTVRDIVVPAAASVHVISGISHSSGGNLRITFVLAVYILAPLGYIT